jgi:hypothetical protein
VILYRPTDPRTFLIMLFDLILVLTMTTTISHIAAAGVAIPMQCSQISLYNACVTSARQRIDSCGQSLEGGVPDLDFYDCQCKEMTSIESCFWHCPDSPEIMAQLSNEQANAQAWCRQASEMRSNQPPSTTSSVPSRTQVLDTKSMEPPVQTDITENQNPGSKTRQFDPITTSNFGPGSTKSVSVDNGSPRATLDLTSNSDSVLVQKHYLELILVLVVLVAMG